MPLKKCIIYSSQVEGTRHAMPCRATGGAQGLIGRQKECGKAWPRTFFVFSEGKEDRAGETAVDWLVPIMSEALASRSGL